MCLYVSSTGVRGSSEAVFHREKETKEKGEVWQYTPLTRVFMYIILVIICSAVAKAVVEGQLDHE